MKMDFFFGLLKVFLSINQQDDKKEERKKKKSSKIDEKYFCFILSRHRWSSNHEMFLNQWRSHKATKGLWGQCHPSNLGIKFFIYKRYVLDLCYFLEINYYSCLSSTYFPTQPMF